MTIRTLALLSILAMSGTSFAVWQLAPEPAPLAEIGADVGLPPIDKPPVAETPDRSQFVAGQTLLLEGRLGHSRIPAGVPHSTFLLATVRGANDAVAPASPLDLTIVLDTSGSMRGARLQNAVEAARGMMRRLRDQDRVSVITYSTQAGMQVPQTTVDAFSRPRLERALDGISPRGETCISCALDLAMRNSRPTPGRVSRILLLSDGEATAGVQDELGFRRIADRCREMGTTVSTIGVDVEYNQRTMGALAQFSNGSHYFVADPSGLPPVFDQEFQSLARTVASDIELVVDLAPGVQVEQIFDRAVRREGDRIIVPVGTVGPGEEKTFLVGLRVPAGTSAEREVADVRLQYHDLVTRGRAQCEGILAARTAEDPTQVAQLDPFVSARLSRSLTVQGIRDANEAAERGQFGEAQRRLSETRALVQANQAGALAAAPAAAAEPLSADFEEQSQALERAGGGFAGPGLGAPTGSTAHREATRRARAQQRSNTSEVLNPFSL